VDDLGNTRSSPHGIVLVKFVAESLDLYGRVVYNDFGSGGCN
jgi:hypothetical protein